MKPHLRLIGDVHGSMLLYKKLASQAQYSIQLGDLNFFYDHLTGLDPSHHRVLGGNHDNYHKEEGKFVFQTEHFLGDFGLCEIPTVPKIFFVRGGNSIDKKYRTPKFDWWPEEELSFAEGTKALELYESLKPEIVISHECPESVIHEVSTLAIWDGEPIRPSSTAKMLQYMLVSHRPKLWIFGHHHKNFCKTIDGTKFMCLNILSYLDIPEGGIEDYELFGSNLL